MEKRKCKICQNEFYAKEKSTKMLCSDKCRKIWAQIPENKEKRIAASQKALLEKNNGKFFFETDEFKKKAKKTKKERYGNENFVNVQKGMDTKEKRYGSRTYNNINKNKRTKNKIVIFNPKIPQQLLL